MIAKAPEPSQKIAIVGTGGIGSTFAFQLARAGHEVTVIARGARLETLRVDGAIVDDRGRAEAVTVSDTLDPETPWDLVLVTVLAQQVRDVLPMLRSCRATTVMFMFNWVEPLTVLQEAVGDDRFAFGFPSIIAQISEGKLIASIPKLAARTVVTDPVWTRVFSDAGIPSRREPDMASWLRTHAALIVPFMSSMVHASRRGAGLRWRQAADHARAIREGVAFVRTLGNPITPRYARVINRLPQAVVAAIFWGLTRLPRLRNSDSVGPHEARTLMDAMAKLAAPKALNALNAIRP